MPELPDIIVYIESLERRILGAPLERLRLRSSFVLRSVDPPIGEVEGKVVRSLRRLGKGIVVGFDQDLFLIFHLMIAGRLRWTDRDRPGGTRPAKNELAAFDFPAGTLHLTEAGSTKRASLNLARGAAALEAHDPGGLEVLESSLDAFERALTRESHTLKRALTDPSIVSGIGNAYSDEILHAARLSPLKLTRHLDREEIERLYHHARDTLLTWIDRLRTETGGNFPEKVTAFREEMAVHGRFNQPCPACGAPIQRVVYAANEANYCARCQTGGKLLADRSLSRLLNKDWPRTLDEWEERREGPGQG